MRLFGNRHNAYEELVSAHLDGQLDAAGEAKLRRHLATCETCATDIREQGAVRDLLRAQPMASVPRSFALPYAPMRVAAPQPEGLGARASSLLRGMQIATAAAAVVLVALIGASIVVPADPVAVRSLAAVESDLGSDKASIEAVSADAEGPLSLAAAPPPDGALAVARTPAPMIGDEPPEIIGASADGDPRSALEWAQLASGIVTALLAITVVGLTWSGARRPA